MENENPGNNQPRFSPTFIATFLSVSIILFFVVLSFLRDHDYFRQSQSEIRHENTQQYKPENYQDDLIAGKDAFNRKEWKKAISLLKPIDTTSEVSVLIDSATFYINKETLFSILHDLEITIDVNEATTNDLLTSLGLNDSYPSILKSLKPNGNELASVTASINSLNSEIATYDEPYGDSLASIGDQLEKIQSALKAMENEGLTERIFAIKRQFDEINSLGIFDAVDINAMTEVVLIAAQDAIPESPFQRMSVSLVVKKMGVQEVMMGDGRREYFPAYQVNNDFKNPSGYRSEAARLLEEQKQYHMMIKKEADRYSPKLNQYKYKLISELKILFKSNDF